MFAGINIFWAQLRLILLDISITIDLEGIVKTWQQNSLSYARENKLNGFYLTLMKINNQAITAEKVREKGKGKGKVNGKGLRWG